MSKLYHDYTRELLREYNSNPEEFDIVKGFNAKPFKGDVNKKIEMLTKNELPWYRYKGTPCILIDTQLTCNSTYRDLIETSRWFKYHGCAFLDLYSLLPLKNIDWDTFKELIKRDLIVKVLDNKTDYGKSVKFALAKEFVNQTKPKWHIVSNKLIKNLQKERGETGLIKIA